MSSRVRLMVLLIWINMVTLRSKITLNLEFKKLAPMYSEMENLYSERVKRENKCNIATGIVQIQILRISEDTGN